MRKSLFVSFLLSLGCLAAVAQPGPTWGPFEPASPWSNIYVGLDAGAQTIWGNSQLSPLRHNVDIQVGKLWNPYLSTRLKFELGRFRTTESNTEYRNRQFTAFVWHADAVVNFSTLFGGYAPARFYNVEGFLGVGMEHTWGAGSAKVNYDSRCATQPALFAGVKNTFRLNAALDANLELQGALMPKEIEGEACRGWRPHGQLSVMVGVAYKFRPRGFTAVSRAGDKQRVTQLERELNACSQQSRQCQQELAETRAALDEARAATARCAPNPPSGAQPQTCPAPKPCGCPTGQCDGASVCASSTGGTSSTDGASAPRPTSVMPEMAVFFDLNSAKISAREALQLQLYADAIKAACCPYAVVGYADIQTGTRPYNERLARARAEAVVNMLVDRYGVNPALLTARIGNLDHPPFADTIYNRTAIIRVP